MLDLYRQSFEEYRAAGLHFAELSFTEADVSDLLTENELYIIRDDELIVAAMCAKTHIDRLCRKTVYISAVATLPDYRHCRLATHLLRAIEERARQDGVVYLTSCTATHCSQSVGWHRHNGFRPYALGQFDGRNYYSVVFCKPLSNRTVYRSAVYLRLRYLFSMLKCKAFRHEDGRPTLLAKVVRKA